MERQTQTGSDQVGTKVLLVDDDRKFCRLVQEYLHSMGYKVTVAHTGGEGLEMAVSADFQAIILDIMMPGMDGFEVLRKLRQTSDVPVLMLTALGEETDRIVGLKMGADDYVPKTFSTRELLARPRAVIRRHVIFEHHRRMQPKTGDVLTVGDLRINLSSRTVRLGEQTIVLTAFEFDLLVSLARSAGQVLTRDQLLNAVASRDYEVFYRSVDVHISSLRKKLGDNPRKPAYIRTFRSTGYMLQTPNGKHV
jgi:DNA-binding response OmpR family regulator